MAPQNDEESASSNWRIHWRSPQLPPRGSLGEFMTGPDAEFDGTLGGAWRLWRETGKAHDRLEAWEAESMICPAEGRTEDIRAAAKQLYSAAHDNGLTIIEDWPELPGVLAEIDFSERLIILAPGQSEDAQMTSLAHEMGHYMDPWLQRNWEWYDRYRHEGDIEIVAQMAAAIFADWYGINILRNTDGYLTTWARYSKARREGTVGDLLERASISGLSLLPQTGDVADELERAHDRLDYRNMTSGLFGRFFRSERKERELGLVDCSDW